MENDKLAPSTSIFLIFVCNDAGDDDNNEFRDARLWLQRYRDCAVGYNGIEIVVDGDNGIEIMVDGYNGIEIVLEVIMVLRLWLMVIMVLGLWL